MRIETSQSGIPSYGTAFQIVVRPREFHIEEPSGLHPADLHNRVWGIFDVSGGSYEEALTLLKSGIADPDEFEFEDLGETTIQRGKSIERFSDGWLFDNHYAHDKCGSSWTDTWYCGCDDDCPHCGAAISPHHSDEITISTEAIEAALQWHLEHPNDRVDHEASATLSAQSAVLTAGPGL